MKKLLVFLALFAFAASGIRAETLVGVWTAERDDDGALHLSLSRERWGLFDVGTLDEAEVAAIESPTPRRVSFERVAPAGTIAFEGTVANGRGGGVFTFEPDPRFNRAMAKLGYEPFSDERLLVFAGRRLSPTVVRDLMDLGYRPDAEDVLKIAIFDIDAAFAREIEGLGLGKPSLEQLVKLRVGRITPPLAREYRSLRLGSLDLDEMAELGIMRATPEYIRTMREAGVEIDSANDAIQLRISRMTAGDVRAYRELGYSDLTARQLSKLGIFEITPDYIRGLRKLGRTNLSVGDLVGRKIRERVVESVERVHRNRSDER